MTYSFIRNSKYVFRSVSTEMLTLTYVDDDDDNNNNNNNNYYYYYQYNYSVLIYCYVSLSEQWPVKNNKK